MCAIATWRCRNVRYRNVALSQCNFLSKKLRQKLFGSGTISAYAQRHFLEKVTQNFFRETTFLQSYRNVALSQCGAVATQPNQKYIYELTFSSPCRYKLQSFQTGSKPTSLTFATISSTLLSALTSNCSNSFVPS